MSSSVSSVSSAPAIRPEAWECFLKEDVFHQMLSSLEFRDLANTQVVNREWNRKVKSCTRSLLIQKIEALLFWIGPEEIKRFSEMEHHQIYLEDLFKSLMIHCPQLAEKYEELFKCRHLLAEKAAEKNPEDALRIYRFYASKELSDKELCAVAEKLGPLDVGEAEGVARKIKNPAKQREALARIIPFADPTKTEALFQECITGEGELFEEPVILNHLLANCPSKKDIIIQKFQELDPDVDTYSALWLPKMATIDFAVAQQFIERDLEYRNFPWWELYMIAKSLQINGCYEHAQTIMRRAKEEIDLDKEEIDSSEDDLEKRYFPPFPFLLKHDPEKTAQQLLEEAGLMSSLDNLEEPKCREFIDNFGQNVCSYYLENDDSETRFELLTKKKICNYYLGKIGLGELKFAFYQNVRSRDLSVLPPEAFADIAWVLKVTEKLYPEQQVFYYLKALDAQARVQETAQAAISSANNNS